MSFREGGLVVICGEPDDVCALCGSVEETRPYGPGYVRICHPCGLKDPMTEARMFHKLFGDPDPEAPSA